MEHFILKISVVQFGIKGQDFDLSSSTSICDLTQLEGDKNVSRTLSWSNKFTILWGNKAILIFLESESSSGDFKGLGTLKLFNSIQISLNLASHFDLSYGIRHAIDDVILHINSSL